jgi:iron(III) transport system ATP-binding protein
MMSNSFLSIQNLVFKRAEKTVIADFNLDLAQGELAFLSGTNGSGKTTLLRLIAGLEKIQAGTISLNGKILSHADVHVPTHQRNIGFVFQDYALFPHLNVWQNLCFGISTLSKQSQKERLEPLVEFLGISQLLQQNIQTLSGGEQQRVALARSLATEPQLLLLDEPFANLDEQGKNHLRKTLHTWLKNKNITTVWVTHDPKDLQENVSKHVTLHKIA